MEFLPYVGTNFYDPENEKRLMFIGIESYAGNKRESAEDFSNERFETSTIRDQYFGVDNQRSPFWRWVRRISTDIVSSEIVENYEKKLEFAFPRIAYTNLFKCKYFIKHPDSSSYLLNPKITDNCLKKSKFVFDEIEKVNPTHVIVFSGVKSFQDEEFYLANIFLEYFNRKPKGDGERAFKMLFKKFKCDGIRFIVTNHPGYSNNEILEKIIETIKKNDFE